MTAKLAYAAPGQGLSPEDLVASLDRHRDHPLVQRFERHAGGTVTAADLGDARLLQPATLVATLADAERVPVDRLALVLGHSLGEISALAVAGALPADAAFDLVVRRGELCAREAAAWPGQMAAVLGLDAATVEYCRRLAARESGELLELACANSATQFVVSGSERSVTAFTDLVAADDGLVKPLPIGGAYHSAAMAGAVDEFATAVRDAGLRRPRVSLLSAIDGRVHDTAEGLDRLLARALVNPVRWRDAVVAARDLGITALVETGPGRTLARLARYDRILPVLDGAGCS